MACMVLKTFADSPEPAVVKSNASFSDHCTSAVKLAFTLKVTVMSQVIVSELPARNTLVLLVFFETMRPEEVDVIERLGGGTA